MNLWNPEMALVIRTCCQLIPLFQRQCMRDSDHQGLTAGDI